MCQLPIARTSKDAPDVPEDLTNGLKSSPINIPVRFLYDDSGSELYEQITQLEEYYPYKAEQHILRERSDDIICHIPKGSIIVELGCGDGSKTSILLNALIFRDGPEAVHFCGIDVSGGALDQARNNLTRQCPDLPPSQLEFIESEYLPGLKQARKHHAQSSLCILWLGSSVGNFSPPDAASFLRDMQAAAGQNSALLLCCDLWKDMDVLHAAYDDSKGVTRKFIINGMHHALSSLGHPAAYDPALWQYDAIVNPDGRQVEMWLTAKAPVHNIVPEIHIAAGEKVLMEISRKFTPCDIARLALAGGFSLHASWRSAKYSVQLLLPPEEALKRCWADTDCIFSGIDVHQWESKPIDLRHPFLFYYGHVASFLRLKVMPPAVPSALDEMLSRGIDPNVLDPSQCHSHPDVPDAWPTRDQLQSYVLEVRKEALEHVSDPSCINMHALIMSLEHERMHQETLAYMLAQQRKKSFKPISINLNGSHTTAPNGVTMNGKHDEDENQLTPFYAHCSYKSSAMDQSGGALGGRKKHPAGMNTETSYIAVPGGQVTLGIDLEEVKGCYVWDNESGTAGPLTVFEMEVAQQPVTVAQFREFVLQDQGYGRRELWDAEGLTEAGTFVSTQQAAPSTWTVTEEGDVYVHMPEQTYHWTEVADCPVYVSLAEARAYAKHHGARIMTEPEYNHIINLQASNNPAATSVQHLESGGWEWTNTAFGPLKGFTPDALYPEYSQDFFDGQHFVLKGSCPYTHPSVRRRSFRNYYQYLYAHMFAQFRLVKAAEKGEE